MALERHATTSAPPSNGWRISTPIAPRSIPSCARVYGADAGLWRNRWRMFLLATAESFGWDKGGVWGVHHYRLAPA